MSCTTANISYKCFRLIEVRGWYLRDNQVSAEQETEDVLQIRISTDHLPAAGPLLVHKVLQQFGEAGHAAHRIQEHHRIHHFRVQLADLREAGVAKADNACADSCKTMKNGCPGSSSLSPLHTFF